MPSRSEGPLWAAHSGLGPPGAARAAGEAGTAAGRGLRWARPGLPCTQRGGGAGTSLTLESLRGLRAAARGAQFERSSCNRGPAGPQGTSLGCSNGDVPQELHARVNQLAMKLLAFRVASLESAEPTADVKRGRDSAPGRTGCGPKPGTAEQPRPPAPRGAGAQRAGQPSPAERAAACGGDWVQVPILPPTQSTTLSKCSHL